MRLDALVAMFAVIRADGVRNHKLQGTNLELQVRMVLDELKYISWISRFKEATAPVTAF